MSKIKYTLKFDRIATLKTSKGMQPVGVVEEFQQNADGSLNLTVKVDPRVPQAIKDAILKDPSCLGMMAVPKLDGPVIILAEAGDAQQSTS